MLVQHRSLSNFPHPFTSHLFTPRIWTMLSKSLVGERNILLFLNNLVWIYHIWILLNLSGPSLWQPLLALRVISSIRLQSTLERNTHKYSWLCHYKIKGKLWKEKKHMEENLAEVKTTLKIEIHNAKSVSLLDSYRYLELASPLSANFTSSFFAHYK